MEGRLIRQLGFTGLVIVGSLGCTRSEVHAPWDGLTSGTPVPGIPMAKKSPWDFFRGTAPSVPVEVAIEPQRTGPPRPETYVAFADAQAEVAFDDSTPVANRESLLDRARQGYQKALQIDPTNAAAQLGLARFYARLGERSKAVDWYNRYLTAHPTDRDVAHEVALAHARWKDWEGAVAWCDFTLKIDPENLSVRKTKAFCLARGGKWEQAFEVMLQVMPEPQARYNIARVLEHMKMTAACRQQLLLALQADPNFHEARDFLASLGQEPGTGDGPGTPSPDGLQQAGFSEPNRP